jgi:DNA polymerase-3 subunit gamma/tau
MVVQVLGEVPPELRVTAEQDERLAAQAKAVAPAEVVRVLELIAAGLRALKDGADARTQLELALVKAAEPHHDASTTALLARVERLEARLSGAAPPAPRAHDPAEAATAAGRAAARNEPEPANDSSAARDEPANDSSPARDELSLAAVTDSWPAVVEHLQGEYPMLAALLDGARPTELDGNELTVSWPESSAFLKRSAEEPAKRERIAQTIRAVTGASLKLVYDLSDDVVANRPELTEEELVARFQKEFDAELEDA